MAVKISVVIPTYRRPALLAKCLHALCEQCFNKDDYEIIVVSDGPDAETLSLVKQNFQAGNAAVRYFFLEKKMGPAAARNFGWQKARGRLIAFTDDDCIPDSDWLHDLLDAYKGETLSAYSGTLKVPVSAKPTDYEKNTANLETASFITANCCCTKAALEITGGFDERFSMAWREDSDLEFKLMQHGVPIIKLVNAVVVHPVRKAPWGVSIQEQKKGMFNALLYKKYPRLYRSKIQPKPAWDYYLVILLVLCFIVAGFYGNTVLMNICVIFWMFFIVRLIVKRLSDASHAPRHIAEMVVTPLIIPFASVYWQLYGAWRYKVLFL